MTFEEIQKIKTKFNYLTLDEKNCILFLLCSILSKRSCILIGDTGSGKSFLIKFLAKMLGQKLNIYQMNNNTGMSIFTGQSVIKEKLTEEENYKLKEIVNNLIKKDKLIAEPIKGLSEPDYYEDIIKKLEDKIKKKDVDQSIIKRLTIDREDILKIISPVNQFIKQKSAFLEAIQKNDYNEDENKKGEWVLIDGIELAPNEVIEKLSSLCGEHPELHIFESGERIHIRKENILPNFHLFITYNPCTTSSRILDKSFINKCLTFTLPQIDSNTKDSSLLLFNSLNNLDFQQENELKIIADICTRIGKVHTYSVNKSKKEPENFAGNVRLTIRNLNFISNEYNLIKGGNKKLSKFLKNSLEYYYWNSISFSKNNKINIKDEKKESKIKELFIKETTEKIIEKNESLIEIEETPNSKYINILKEIRKFQLASRGNKDSGFNLNFLVNNILQLKFHKEDLTFIFKHLNDTLDLIEEMKDDKECNIKGQLYSIKIITNLIEEILKLYDQEKITSKYYEYNFNSEEIYEITELKNLFLRFKLFQILLSKNKIIIEINSLLFSDEKMAKFLNSLIKTIDNNNLYDIKSLIEFISDNNKYL